ncbi:xanthine dehydrogenase family protein molybdopterin-binding subunit [Desulfosporosinus meridiei]|uniref:Aerobic-type carbon monoxide dehydrogenase, large subunit CoxL/CutL-like protein n=1 Tax=Desulfosporosinus meridiei (strain ATCC BAA-275 / DSM 13257 / KCTC 12902 / NCIMB 13706 / S10) TaxID=768704 RepID=J7IUU8_DESMD|nr:molybdopterin cofactor-binding domain-containing protein [Desulfosporosinus meridiei]AFQ42873.1 aerobic-type carbon monoxide dehydrogenase, large subunit CoxL/CutL-like protein [Desulfosporosinus meridiei DSM 13257]
MKNVGHSIRKIDGMAIATGKPVYTEDLAMPNALVIKILRSPHAYAKITSIDVSRAESIEGVECVLTYRDVPNQRFTLAGQSYPEPSPYDRLILDQVLRYVGDEVAIIAAVDEKTANRAMKNIKVEYEVLNPVLDFEEAIGHPSVVHPEEDLSVNFDIGLLKEMNITSSSHEEVGDVEEEFKHCAVIVEDVYYPQAQAHTMMETYRSFTYLDHAGRLVVLSSTQVPFHIRRQLARALQIPASKIRVIKPRIGGGFGGKQTGAGDIFAAIVTIKTGKPALIIYDRKETFSATTSRHAMRLKVKLGADSDGIIKAIDMEVLSDTGAYGEHAPTVLSCVGHYTLPLYNKTRAVRFDGKAVYTNKMPAGAFRGYGATQGTFALESTVNKLAEQLNMDPTEIRLKNISKVGETFLTGQGVALGSTFLDRCIAKGKELISWEEKFPRQEIGDNKVRAVGMAITMQGSGIANIGTASVEIRLNDDGNFTLLTGATDMGTGCDTILTQIAADALEVPMEMIIINAGDTDTSPYDPGSYASSTTYLAGSAVIKAAEELRGKILEQGALFLGVSVEDVELDGLAVRSLREEKDISFAKLAELTVLGNGKLQLVGYATHGSEVSPPPYVAGFAEVEVDQETGKVDLIDYVAVIDCGTVINPALARIQAEGGIAQGIGMALYEQVRYDEIGKMATNSFMQYKIPTRKDVGKVRIAFEESFEPTGPFGAKSIGEVVANTPPPAIAHAIYNAVGVRENHLPITPEKVFLGMLK